MHICKENNMNGIRRVCRRSICSMYLSQREKCQALKWTRFTICNALTPNFAMFELYSRHNDCKASNTSEQPFRSRTTMWKLFGEKQVSNCSLGLKERLPLHWFLIRANYRQDIPKEAIVLTHWLSLSVFVKLMFLTPQSGSAEEKETINFIHKKCRCIPDNEDACELMQDDNVLDQPLVSCANMHEKFSSTCLSSIPGRHQGLPHWMSTLATNNTNHE